MELFFKLTVCTRSAVVQILEKLILQGGPPQTPSEKVADFKTATTFAKIYKESISKNLR